MPINISVPILRGNLSTKDQIVSILSEEWPLSVKDIHSRIAKEKGEHVSYQAVHKLLKQLEVEEVIKLSEKKYSLSKQWARNIKGFAERIEAQSSPSNGLESINTNFSGTKKIIFDDFRDLCVSMAKLFIGLSASSKRKKIAFGLFRHLWVSLSLDFRDFSLIKKMVGAAADVIVVSYSSSPLDKWVAQQYYAAGFSNVKLGIGPEKYPGEDIVVFGDLVFRVKFSEDTIKILDEIYGRNSNVADLFKEYAIQKIITRKLHIEVDVSCDPALAKMFKMQLNQFLAVKSNAD